MDFKPGSKFKLDENLPKDWQPEFTKFVREDSPIFTIEQQSTFSTLVVTCVPNYKNLAVIHLGKHLTLPFIRPYLIPKRVKIGELV